MTFKRRLQLYILIILVIFSLAVLNFVVKAQAEEEQLPVFEITDTEIITGQGVIIMIESEEEPVTVEIDQKMPLGDIKSLLHIKIGSEYGVYPNHAADFILQKNKPSRQYTVVAGDGMLDMQYILLTPSTPGDYILRVNTGIKTNTYALSVKKGKGSFTLTDQVLRLRAGIGLSNEPISYPDNYPIHLRSDIEHAKNMQVRRLENQSAADPAPWRTYNPAVRFDSFIITIPDAAMTITELDVNGEGWFYINIPYSDIQDGKIAAHIDSNLWYSPNDYFAFSWGFVQPDIKTMVQNLPVKSDISSINKSVIKIGSKYFDLPAGLNKSVVAIKNIVTSPRALPIILLIIGFLYFAYRKRKRNRDTENTEL